MSRLEQRYRRLLRLLPAAYRDAWEEDMVATFLDSMDSDDAEAAEYAADFGRPSWSEVASVASLAIRLRLDVAGAPPRSVAWGQALRLVALMGLLVHAVVETVEAGLTLWLAGTLGWLPAPPADWVPALPPGAWHTVWSLAGLLWLPAFVGLLLGHWRAARLLAVLALLPDAAAAISATLDLAGGAAPLLLTVWSNLLVDTLLVLALVAFHLSLLDYALVTAGGQRSALLAVGATEALAVLAVGAPLARRAATMLRRLPSLPAAPTASF
jgi:hypothetical protein